MSLSENFEVSLRHQYVVEDNQLDAIIKFRKDKVFSVRLTGNSTPKKVHLLVNLEVFGLKAVKVEVTCPTVGTSKAVEEERYFGSLQLFSAILYSIISSAVKHIFTFNVQATVCVGGYEIKLIDSLLKSQLWMDHHRQSDVALLVSKKSFPCHKAIPAARSRVFLDKFTANPNLSQLEINHLSTSYRRRCRAVPRIRLHWPLLKVLHQWTTVDVGRVLWGQDSGGFVC